MRKKILFIAGMMACCTWASAQEISRTWVADKGNGTYQNPVLYADYSDPDVCEAGDDFYMTASSFNCIPGLPILHSRDLVNWSLVNYALPVQEPKEFFDKAQHGKGVWAPAIRFHKGEFYIYWGDPDYGIYMIKTRDPKGSWSKPVLVKAGKGMIDPTPLWDEDGKVYLIHAYAGSRSGVNSILVICELNAEEEDIVRRQDGSMLVEASMNIKDFMEEMGILSYEDLEDEDFTTLGGLAMFLLGGIPKAGDIFTYKNLQFEVVDMDRGRVDKLLVIKRDEE